MRWEPVSLVSPKYQYKFVPSLQTVSQERNPLNSYQIAMFLRVKQKKWAGLCTLFVDFHLALLFSVQHINTTLRCT